MFCGFVSTTEQWLHFDNDWLAVLRMPQFDLEYLHMKEMNTGKGRFAKFKNNLDLQRDLYQRLHRLIRVRYRETFGGIVFLDDYRLLDREYLVEEHLGPPIVMAAQLAIQKLMKWHAIAGEGKPIRIALDQGIKPWGRLCDLVYEEYGFRLIPALASETPPLQAADMTAWEIHRAMSKMLNAGRRSIGGRELRGSFRHLLEKLGFGAESNWFLFDEDEMRRIFPEHPDVVPRRGGVS